VVGVRTLWCRVAVWVLLGLFGWKIGEGMGWREMRDDGQIYRI
jgi:hypothetical protein